MIIKRLLLIIPFAWATATGFAAEEHVPFDTPHVDLGDRASLQRGARIFVNFCLSCHSAAFMRYDRMGSDLGISDDLIRENLMFGDHKVGDLMRTTMPPDDARKWFGTAPPDLSLVARSRGPDWLYTYLRSFYVDEDSPSGWNNTVFPNVAMPHALYEWQGAQRAVYSMHTETFDGEEVELKEFDRFELIKPGSMDAVEFDAAMRDLTNFLVYLAEPAKLVRYRIGFWVLLFVVFLGALSYLLKKEYWRGIH